MSARLSCITLLALLACSCSSSCSPTRRRTPSDTLVVAIESPMATADPRYAISNYDEKLGKLIAPGLTTVETPTGEPRLLLAAAIDHVDPTTIDVTLRPDARFSDGSPVTASDVARTYQSVLDPACASTNHVHFIERFAAVEPRGDRVVRFELVAPLGTFVTDITYGVLSFHDTPPGECHPPRVIGAGPYALVELTGDHALLDANRYALAPPRVPHVDIRFVRDASARLIMLVGGSVDVLQNSARADLVDDIAKQPRVALATAPSLLLTYLMFNNDAPPLGDVRVRQAIALAIDREAIVRAELAGRAVLATGLLAPMHWAYEPDVPRWLHDPARAEALLDAAGLPRGADGVRAHLVYKTSSDAFRVAIAHLIARQLADVGLDVDVRPFEFATFFADIKRGNYQLATMQTTPITEPDFYHFYFHSTHIPDAHDPDGGNRWRYRNPEIDRLTEAGRREQDPVVRKTIYADVQRIIARDVPIVPLWHEDNVVLTNALVQGYEINAVAGFAGLTAASIGGSK